MNGAAADVESGGYVRLTEAFQPGDVVELALPMEPRFTVADPRIDAVRGCVAVERGPEVLCLESVDTRGTCTWTWSRWTSPSRPGRTTARSWSAPAP